MKDKKDNKNTVDDTLFGLLSVYKAYNTYFRILVSEEIDSLIILLTDNPGKWGLIHVENHDKYRILKRSDIGTNKLLVKYLAPEHIINQIGPTLGIKLPPENVKITDNIKNEGYFILETGFEFITEVKQNIKKIIELPPKKKYEILEKSLLHNS